MRVEVRGEVCARLWYQEWVFWLYILAGDGLSGGLATVVNYHAVCYWCSTQMILYGVYEHDSICGQISTGEITYILQDTRHLERIFSQLNISKR